MTQTCSVENCAAPVKARGMCKLHYQRAWRTGSPHVSRPCLRGSTEDRFWRHIKRGANNECWEWQAFRDRDGYGKLRVGNSNRAAHIVSWELHFGPVPEGMLVRHKCNNPPCANPAHLRLGTHQANMQDRMEAGHYPVNEAAPATKFSNAVVEAIRKAKGPAAEVGKQFGVSASQVRNIRRGNQRPAPGSDCLPEPAGLEQIA